MKKKLNDIVKVSDVFKRLVEKHFNNFSLSYKLAKASKEIEEQTSFYVKEERKIIEQYALKDDNKQIKILEGNRIGFKTAEDASKFNEEILKLQELEIDIFEPIMIHSSDFKYGEMDLTPSDILKLEGFIEFVDDEH